MGLPSDKKNVYFPHLLPVEVSVWRNFISAHGHTFDRFDYDVHVGAGRRPGAPAGDVYADNFRDLTQKRIDAIGWTGTYPTIFEVRERADLQVIGKLIGYGRLWERENPMLSAPELALVCRIIGPDDRFVASDKRISIYEV